MESYPQPPNLISGDVPVAELAFFFGPFPVAIMFSKTPFFILSCLVSPPPHPPLTPPPPVYIK